MARRRGLRGRAVPSRRPRRGARAVVGDLRARLAADSRADGGGPRSGGAPESRRVPRLDAPDAETHRGAAAGSRDPPRPAEVARARADDALSAAVVPRGADPRVPPRRAHVDDRGEDGALSRRVALHRMVQPAPESRHGGARAADHGRTAGWRAAGRGAVAGGPDARRRPRRGTITRSMASPAG